MKINKYIVIESIINDTKLDELYKNGYSKVDILKCIIECEKEKFIERGYSNITVTDDGLKYFEYIKRKNKLNRILK